MDKDQKNADTPETGEPEKELKKGAKENFYDKIPLTVKQLDIIIVVLIIAFVVCLVLGALIGNGVIEDPFF